MNKVPVLGKNMAYRSCADGQPIIFLHGNPVSSYLWRNVMPRVAGCGRCIAPDLIGMGESDKLKPDVDTYSFATHSLFLDAFIDSVTQPNEQIVLVVHDWGSALGFDWARRHPDRIGGIAYMESIVRPFADWLEFSEPAERFFTRLRSDIGEAMILDRNLFIERILPNSILRSLSEEEMDVYRKPFLEAEHRWPMLSWPRSIPVAGEPVHMVELVQAYADWMAQAAFPKLFINADPGVILTGAPREFCRAWLNQTEVTFSGSHFIQEDSGPEIGDAISAWMKAKGLTA